MNHIKKTITSGTVEYKAKFKHGLVGNEPIELTYCISLDWLFDSDKDKKYNGQTGNGFLAFVELVNKHKSQIFLLNIVFADYLQRWYIGEEQVNFLSEQWLDINKNALKILEVPFKYSYWKQYIMKQEYSLALECVRKLFCTDKYFKNIVEQAATKNFYKAVICGDYDSKKQMAKEYLLEECAFILIFDGVLTYPSKLNAALEYILNKRTEGSLSLFSHHDIKFIQHSLNVKPPCHYKYSEQNTTEQSLIASCIHTVQLLKKHDIISPKKQIEFFQEFTKLLNRYLK